MLVIAETRRTRSSSWSTSTSSARSPGRSRWSTRRSPHRSASNRCPRRRPRRCTRRPRDRRPQRRHARRDRRSDRDLLGEIWAYSVLHGAAASPFDALDGLRGIRTLAVRSPPGPARCDRVASPTIPVSSPFTTRFALPPPTRAPRPGSSRAADGRRVDVAGGVDAARTSSTRCGSPGRHVTRWAGDVVCHPATSPTSASRPRSSRCGVTAGRCGCPSASKTATTSSPTRVGLSRPDVSPARDRRHGELVDEVVQAVAAVPLDPPGTRRRPRRRARPAAATGRRWPPAASSSCATRSPASGRTTCRGSS